MMTFLDALLAGNIKEIREILGEGADVNAPCRNGTLPLHIALDTRNWLLVKVLLDAGAAPNSLGTDSRTKEKKTPLQRLFGDEYNMLLGTEEIDEIVEKLFLLDHTFNLEPFLNDLTHLVLKTNNINLATWIIEKVGASNLHTKRKYTPLHLACQLPITKILPGPLLSKETKEVESIPLNKIAFLIDKGIPLNAINDQGRTALDMAIHNPELVQFLLEKGAVFNQIAPRDLVSLAPTENFQFLQEYLISRGILKKYLEDEPTALHHIYSLEAADWLLQHGADINAVNQEGYTPLLSFLKRSLAEEVIHYCQWFKQRGASLAIVDNQNQNLLHHLVSRPLQAEAIAFLVREGLSINAQDKNSMTPMHCAARSNQWGYISLLLSLGADPMLLDRFNNTVLENLTLGEHIDENLILNLLNYYPRGKLPKNSETLVDIALRNGFCQLLNSLIQRGMTRETIQKHEPLSTTILNGQTEMFKWLIEQNIDTLENNPKLIWVAVETLNVEIIKFLKERNANFLDINSEEESLLYHLCYRLNRSGYFFRATLQRHIDAARETVRLLIQNGVDINHKNKAGYTALEILIGNYQSNDPVRNTVITEILQCPNVMMPDKLDNIYYIINYLYQNKNLNIWRTILEKSDSDRRFHLLLQTLADYVIRDGDSQFLVLLLDNGLDVNTYINGHDGKQSLLQAAFLSAQLKSNNPANAIATLDQYFEVITCLIKAGAYLYLPSTDVFPPFLHHSVQANWYPIVKLLLEHHYPVDLEAYITNRLQRRAVTPLFLAVAYGYQPIVELLIRYSANANYRLSSGKTLLHVACQAGHYEIIKLLLGYGLDPTLKVQDTEEQTLYAVEKSVLDYVIDSKLEMEVKEKIIELLFPYFPTFPLPIVRKVLNANLSFNLIKKIIDTVKPNLFQSLNPLHIAVEKKNLELVQYLISWNEGALLHTIDAIGRTPLHMATLPGRETIFECVLKAGANQNKVDNNGFTPALYALFYDTHEILGVNLNIPFFREYKRLQRHFLAHPNCCSLFEAGNLFLSGQYAYKLISIFSNFQTVLDYIQRHQDPKSYTSLHDLCLFTLPEGGWDRHGWASLALEHGSKATRYLALAPRIDVALGRAPTRLEEIEQIIKDIHYLRWEEAPEMAKLFQRCLIDENVFNNVLNTYQVKIEDYLPALYVNGESIDQPRFYFKKLAKDDLRGFVLGALTHCCQSVGNAGHTYAMHGMTSPYGGFYAVFKKEKANIIEKKRILSENAEAAQDFNGFLNTLKEKEQKKKYLRWREETTISLQNQACSSDSEQIMQTLREQLKQEYQEAKEDKLIAQSWAWLSEEGGLVFDSWESLRPEEDNKLCEPFLRQAAQQALTAPSIIHVLLGKGGKTPNGLSFKTAAQRHYPREGIVTWDSSEQWLVDSKEFKENNDKISPNLVAHSVIFASPIENSYSLEQFYENLQSRISGAEFITLLPPLMLKIPAKQWEEPEIVRMNESDILPQLPDTDCTLILPILNEGKSWSAWVMERKIINQASSRGNNEHWRYIYLDATGSSLSHYSETTIEEILRKFKAQEPITARHHLRSSAIYTRSVNESADWLLEVLNYFSKTGDIITPPLQKLRKLSKEEIRILEEDQVRRVLLP